LTHILFDITTTIKSPKRKEIVGKIPNMNSTKKKIPRLETKAGYEDTHD
jgi:hypothetical protein